MKKLLFAIAGAVAFSAFAADPSARTDDIDVLGFENFDLTDPTTVTGAVIGRTDAGITGDSKWTCAGDDASLVKTYGGDNIAAPSSITEPRPFAGENTQYLALDTNGSELQRAIPAAGQAIAADGTYIDTLVQFTPSETAPTAADLTGAKLAIWLGVVNNVTNLYVAGGQYSAASTDDEDITVTAKSYKLSGSYEQNTWYRLTVKAIKTIAGAGWGGSDYSGFQIFIDGTLLTIVGDSAYDTESAALDWFADGVMSDTSILTGGTFIPSADTTLAAPTLTSVGFKGTGALDDFVVTTADPFAPVPVDFTLTWPSGYTAVSYTIDGGEAVSLAGESSGMQFQVLSGKTVAFTFTNADGAQKTLTGTAGTDAGLDATDATFTWADYLGEAVNGAYEIDDLAELKLFQKGIAITTNELKLATAGETFKLTADIALDAPWPGVGVQNGKDIYSTETFNGAAFQGTFDGQNHTISGFQMQGGGLDYCGFFNSTYGATIQNLKIQYAGGLFAADTATEPASNESGATFVGVAKNSTLRNLTTVAGTVSCYKGFGGIVGFLTSGTLVDSCTNNVNMTSLKPNKCGGIAMITQGGSAVTICNCQNNGSVAGSGEIGSAIGYIGLDVTISNFESTVAYKMFQHQSSTATLQGTIKGNATVDPYTGQATPGLNFATVDGSVATFVADGALAAGNIYKVMHTATATYEFAAAGSISFDTNLIQAVTFAITAPGLDLTDATANGVVTFTAAAQGTELEPGEQDPTVYTTQADATAALANVTIVEPEDVSTNTTISAADKEAYDALFEAKVVEVAGGYAIEVGLKAQAEAALQGQADDNAAEIVDAINDSEVTFDTTPGLYYSIKWGTTLSMDQQTEKVLATGSTLTLDLPKGVGATTGFYKVMIDVTK